MSGLRFSLVALLVAVPAVAADSPADEKPAPAVHKAAFVPPVLRNNEPADNSIVTLPGPARVKVAPPPAPPAPAPAPAPEKPPAKVIEAVVQHPAPAETKPPAPLASPKPLLPPDFVRDSALFCQSKIGQWTEADTRSVLGNSQHHRSAFEDDHSVSGTIYAYSDPTGRYKQLELDFDKTTGRLRTVFAYPLKMTWQECRRLWGANVSSTDANKGRTFYSYLNRHLDVLVGSDGQVISLGLY